MIDVMMRVVPAACAVVGFAVLCGLAGWVMGRTIDVGRGEGHDGLKLGRGPR